MGSYCLMGGIGPMGVGLTGVGLTGSGETHPCAN
jgi:hypothetical protein